MDGEVRLPVRSDADIVKVRQQGRALARDLGFSSMDQALFATALSEILRNIVEYAGHGEIVIGPIQEGASSGILVVATDQGPGIPDIDQAMRDGYSTSGSMGVGLPGARRIMDEFFIESEVGRGTTVTMKKWKS